MSYEQTSGLNVSNHYGARETGGGEGVIKTEGTLNEYSINFDGDGPLGLPFPVLDGVKVVGVDSTFAAGTLGTATIGGVNVKTSSEASPVDIPASNTGAVVMTGITAGELVVKFKRLAK